MNERLKFDKSDFNRSDSSLAVSPHQLFTPPLISQTTIEIGCFAQGSPFVTFITRDLELELSTAPSKATWGLL